MIRRRVQTISVRELRRLAFPRPWRCHQEFVLQTRIRATIAKATKEQP